MSRAITLLTIFTGIMLLFYFSGLLPENSANKGLLDLALNPEKIKDKPFWEIVIDELAGIVLISAVLAGLAIYSPQLAISLGATIYLASLLYDFTNVYVKVHSATPVLAVLFFAPIFVMMMFAIHDWWRGYN